MFVFLNKDLDIFTRDVAPYDLNFELPVESKIFHALQREISLIVNNSRLGDLKNLMYKKRKSLDKQHKLEKALFHVKLTNDGEPNNMTIWQSEIKKPIFLIVLISSSDNSTLTLECGCKCPHESGDSLSEKGESDQEHRRSDFGLPLLVLPNRIHTPGLVHQIYMPSFTKWRKRRKVCTSQSIIDADEK